MAGTSDDRLDPVYRRVFFRVVPAISSTISTAGLAKLLTLSIPARAVDR